jgi:signal transduction histidine kinase
MYEMVPQGMALLAGCLLIWGVMHLLVTRRVDDILAYAHAVSVGDAPPMPPLGDDELEAIGRGFGDAVGKVISTEASLLEAGELERQRIGRDLHDDVCQRISAAQMRIGVMGEALSAQGSPLAQTSREIEADLSAAAQIARGFARGLAPVALDTQGLDTAFMELAAFLERSFGVQCDLSCDEGMESLGAGVKTHLFRIAQELATNAAKHAQGSFIAIRLRGDEDGVELQVENDGKDFVETSGGLGLQFVRQRVRTLGGHMQIKKREGGLSGSVVVCTVPSQTHINLSPPIKRP